MSLKTRRTRRRTARSALVLLCCASVLGTVPVTAVAAVKAKSPTTIIFSAAGRKN